MKPGLRHAVHDDVESLVAIENACFETDRLSRRSFFNLVRPGSHDLLVIEVNGKLAGYVLNLYRNNTNLARIYSIAVLPEARGRGLAMKLIDAAEQAATTRHCVFVRLEVSVNNAAAIGLYEGAHYKRIGIINSYYEDGSDALRMEKRIHRQPDSNQTHKPYYQQTTEFTCGPASLMMAMKALKPDYEFNRTEELQIWREATTIFMTSGHGGCSPHGLALSAWKRGFLVSIYTNYREAPFIESVRDEEKKAVIKLVHEDFMNRINNTAIDLHIEDLAAEQMDDIMKSGGAVIALISTWRLNRSKAPHWVYVTGTDNEFVYINDPDVISETHLTETDYINVPLTTRMFQEMAQFGQKRLRCLVVLEQYRG